MYNLRCIDSATVPPMAKRGRPPKSPEPAHPNVAGANILLLREQLGLSQAGLAKLAGISRSAIVTAERGTYKSTDLSTVEAVAPHLGVTPAELLTPRLKPGEPAEAHIQAFLESAYWRVTLAPTDAEVHWLRSLPIVVFGGGSPTPDTIGKLVAWRRDHSPGGQPAPVVDFEAARRNRSGET